MSFLRIWGCESHVKKLTTDKLSSKTEKCLFVGYLKKTKGYYFYNPNEDKVLVARRAVVLEREFISKKNSGSEVQLEEVQVPQIPTQDSVERENISQEVVETQPSTHDLRRSDRVRRKPERYGFLITDDQIVELIEDNEPTTYREAIESPVSDKWIEAMKSEMQSMYNNQVWTLVDPSESAKVIDCNWIFKFKTGNIFKGRLVAKGFKQTHGIDYDETFSPAVKLKSIRILLAIAAYYDYEI